jgi:hypothetical protein
MIIPFPSPTRRGDEGVRSCYPPRLAALDTPPYKLGGRKCSRIIIFFLLVVRIFIPEGKYEVLGDIGNTFCRFFFDNKLSPWPPLLKREGEYYQEYN